MGLQSLPRSLRLHRWHHRCEEITLASIYTTVGICRPEPGARLVTPVFRGACGQPCAQLLNNRDLRISGFVHLDLGEEYQAIEERATAALGDEVIHAFETASGEILLAPGRDLAARLVAEPLLVGDCARTAEQVRLFVASMKASAPR